MPIITKLSTGFLGLPGELRNRVYELVLLQDEPINPFEYSIWETDLTPTLFLANRYVHRETTLFFYSRNIFDITTTPSRLSSFLEQIGSKNAGHVRHIITSFPIFLHLEPCNVILEDDSITTLELIQTGFVSLKTLETSLYSTNSMEIRLDSLDHNKLATEVLELINASFRAIPSIQDIIVNVFEDGPSDFLRSAMKSYGWTINTTVYEVEDDDERGYSEFDYDYDDDGFDYDSGDEYDIDNDSDFWRRAAD